MTTNSYYSKRNDFLYYYSFIYIMARVFKWIGIFCVCVFGLGIVGAMMGGGDSTSSTQNNSSTGTVLGVQETTAASSEAVASSQPVQKEEPKVPTEFKSALRQAESYSKTMNMSKQGVYDQLISEYGGKFSAEAAQYAVDNVQADWNANALATAENYQKTMNMSPNAIHDQLTSAYGSKFTQAEADFAIANLK